MSDNRIVLTTCGSLEEGRTLARAVVERRLAACVNIIPQIESIYRWQGKVEPAAECLLVIKTTAAAVAPLREAFRELHSCELPESVEIGVEGGTAAYLDWIRGSVGQ